MTPLGLYLREQRKERGITQREMAVKLNVSPAYLSALEHGHRGLPSFDLLQRIIGYLNVIWDDAEKLQKIATLSNPRVTIDTTTLSADATELANQLEQKLGSMSEQEIGALLNQLKD